MVGASPTQLDTIDVTIAAGDTFKLEITDANKKVYHNGSEVLSSTDNSLTAAGTWGFFIGDYNGVGGHYRDNWNIDNFLAEEFNVNIAPVISLPGSSLNYTENDGAVVIDGTATVTDADGGDFDTGTLMVQEVTVTRPTALAIAAMAVPQMTAIARPMWITTEASARMLSRLLLQTSLSMSVGVKQPSLYGTKVKSHCPPWQPARFSRKYFWTGFRRRTGVSAQIRIAALPPMSNCSQEL